MTRINVIPTEELVREHLVAEYRELPRIFGCVRKRVEKGHELKDIKMPEKYILGNGHMTFFYDKLKWITDRYKLLIQEMKLRNYKPKFSENDIPDLYVGIPKEFFGDYVVTEEAIEINRARIRERLNESRK
jgi:deoxyribonuclease (pyrimidine dimer)